MSWTEVAIGKFKDNSKTLPQILFSDPDWFFWAVETGIFQNRPRLHAEAADLQRKATHIRVPQKDAAERQVVEHYIHAPTMKYSHFIVVPESKPSHTGSSPSMRADVIDMSFPRKIAKFDKTGCKLLIDSLKQTYFGSKSKRMTKALCEQFFDDGGNFSL